MTKIRNGFIALLLIVAAFAIVPKLPLPSGNDPRLLPTITYEGTVIQLERPAPDLKTYREAQRRPDKAVLVVRWRGNRSFYISWEAGPARGSNKQVLPYPGDNGITTWSKIVDVKPGDYVAVDGVPNPQRREGWASCVIIHAGSVLDQEEKLIGHVICDDLIPA